MGVEFFCYHRDRPGSVGLREELREQHWSYMDRYQAEMIARGPTLADGDDAPTGSVHIVGLPGPAAARAFAFDEPNYQAGVYRDVLLRRWRNLLGRTMWDFPGGPDGGAGAGTAPRRGVRCLDPGPVCGDRGPPVAIRRAAVLILRRRPARTPGTPGSGRGHGTGWPPQPGR